MGRVGGGARPVFRIVRVGLTGQGDEMGRAVSAILRRPRLWPAALTLVPDQWWRRWPPIPFPSRDYLRFRMQTMYGDQGALRSDDVIAYLEWCRRMRVLAR
jgi:hypothetical protein